MKPAIVTILYSDAKRKYFPTEEMYIAEAEVKARAKVIAKYLRKLNIEVITLPGDANIMQRLRDTRPDMVVNLVDTVRGEEYLCCAIPGVLEVASIPYTGTGILGLSLSTNKFLTKKILEQNNIPVPPYQLFSTPYDPIKKSLRFPVISKLNSVHGSVAIHLDSISENETQLRRRLRYLIKTYDDDVLVEHFIKGREISAILLEGLNKKIYLGEKIFEGSWRGAKYHLATFEAEWGQGDSFHYAKFPQNPLLANHIRKAYDVLKIEDYAKFEIMIANRGHYFIDSNPNAELGPKELDCDIGLILDLYGINFTEILRRLIKNCMNGTALEVAPLSLLN